MERDSYEIVFVANILMSAVKYFLAPLFYFYNFLFGFRLCALLFLISFVERKNSFKPFRTLGIGWGAKNTVNFALLKSTIVLHFPLFDLWWMYGNTIEIIITVFSNAKLLCFQLWVNNIFVVEWSQRTKNRSPNPSFYFISLVQCLLSSSTYKIGAS